MKWKSWIPAFLVAGLTLFVFFVLQNFGPQSAVRRFHNAILRRDSTELRASVLESTDSKSVRVLVDGVSRLLLNGPPALAGSRHEPNEEQLLLTYRDDQGNVFPIVFFVEKRPGQRNWKVNSSKTSIAFENYLRNFYLSQ
jgi:hypothetical protein